MSLTIFAENKKKRQR